MATPEQMKGYAAHLDANTPASSKGRPVTELCIFKMLPAYEADHDAALAEFKSQIVANTAPGTPNAKGIKKICWGFSMDDPKTFIWALDWDKIEDHWDFWQTPGFPPVMGAISKLFEAGRPLVRHYDFGEQGILDESLTYARVFVWDDGDEGKAQGRAAASANTSSAATQTRSGYAVDMDETSWWGLLLGYGSESDAREDTSVKAPEGAESHVVRLTYA